MLVARYSAAFARHGLTVGQVLLTADDVIRRAHYRNAQRTFERLLGLGVVPVVNENDTVATEEIRFGDNDRLAALVTHLVAADALVLLSDVDAVYDDDPGRFGATAAARPGSPMSATAADLAHVRLGSGGRARRRQRRHGHQGGRRPDRRRRRRADPVGARRSSRSGARRRRRRHLLPPRPASARPARLLWLAHATTATWRPGLDAGAVAAVVQRRTSLLPAGITAVEGEFAAGDPVDLLDPDGRPVARGLVAYDAAELPPLLGRSTRELGQALGSAYSREVVHRDDLVLLS